MSARSPSTFDRCAGRYDELRPVDESWWRVYDEIVRLADPRGRRVLEVGCGTGRLAEALAAREAARVWAVDASAEMVARARDAGVNARVARAEALPFKAGWFERALLRMVAHLLDRRRAFGELARVLGPGGRVVVATEDPANFEEAWFARWFPSVPELERRRFPDEEMLIGELREAGLEDVRCERLAQDKEITRRQALEVIRARAYSTFDILAPDEYEAGLARAEDEAPELLRYRFHWLFAVARR